MSTDNQAKDGTSLVTQEQSIEEYIKHYNNQRDYSNDDKPKLELDEILVDVMSASNHDNNTKKNTDILDQLKKRPCLQNILNAAMNKEFSHLIVYTRDRLVRDKIISAKIKYILKRCNVTIHYSKPGENFNSNNSGIDTLFDSLLSIMGEYEVLKLSSRVKSNMRTMVLDGQWSGGRAPYGYQPKHRKSRTSKSLLEPKKDERIIVKRVLNLKKQGYGEHKIAQIINGDNNTNESNRDKENNTIKWNRNKVHNLLRRERYTGYSVWNVRRGGLNPNSITEIVRSNSRNRKLSYITLDDWNDIVKINKKKLEYKDPRYYDTPFLFKYKLFCSKCHAPLSTKNYGKYADGTTKRVYICPTKDNKNKAELKLDMEKIHKKIFTHLENTLIINDTTTLWKAYSNKVTEESKYRKSAIKTLNKKISVLSEMIDKLSATISSDFNIEKLDNVSFTKNSLSNINNENLKLNMKEKLIDLLNRQNTELNNALNYYENQLNSLKEHESKIKPLAKKQFNYRIRKFNNSICNIILSDPTSDNHSKRVFIDEIIDKIIISKETGEILDIYLTPVKNVKWLDNTKIK